MKLGELYNQIEAKKRRIMQNAVENVPKWELVWRERPRPRSRALDRPAR
jgi:hypothetical protein